MVKQVVWSFRAQTDRKEILEYWKIRNGNNEYSARLNNSFKSATKLIGRFPKIGRPTDKQNIRIVVVKDYL